MKKITIPGFIYAEQPESWQINSPEIVDGVSYRFSVYDLNKPTKLCPFEMTFELPKKFNPIDGLVKNLKAEKQKVRTEFQARITDIDRQINQLLAIEN